MAGFSRPEKGDPYSKWDFSAQNRTPNAFKISFPGTCIFTWLLSLEGYASLHDRICFGSIFLSLPNWQWVEKQVHLTEDGGEGDTAKPEDDDDTNETRHG